MESTQATQEALVQLLKDQKKLLRRFHIVFAAVLILIVVVVAALLFMVPRATALVEHMETSLTEIDTLVNNANTLVLDNTEAVGEAVSRINAVDFEGLDNGINTMVSDADKLLTENTEAVTDAIEKINNVDFDRLNQAINDLADIVEPLAKVANMFR